MDDPKNAEEILREVLQNDKAAASIQAYNHMTVPQRRALFERAREEIHKEQIKPATS